MRLGWLALPPSPKIDPVPRPRFKSSRVRLGVLQCLQAMAKADSRALHLHWTALLPLQQPLLPRPALPHLLTMVLHDPVAKVRGGALIKASL